MGMFAKVDISRSMEGINAVRIAREGLLGKNVAKGRMPSQRNYRRYLKKYYD
jgi:hypothetical protein